MLEKLQEFIIRHKYMALLIAIVISLMGVSNGPSLPIRLSITHLLPENTESVVDMHQVEEEAGGAGFLVVLIGPLDDPVQHLPDIAKLLKQYSDLKYVFYEKEAYTLKNRLLYVMPRDEFRDLRKHAQNLFDEDGSGGFFSIGEADREEIELNKQKAREFFASFKKDSDPKRFYESLDKKYAMVLAKPAFNSEDLARSKTMVDFAQNVVESKYGKDFPYHFVGRYVNKVRDTKQIQKDIARTGVISLTLISLVLILGLGSIRGAMVTVGGVIISLGWTVGIAHLLVGQINILTGFLLAILGGLGVEYGIHLFRRYDQEVKSGVSHQQALRRTYFQVGRALSSAAITSSSAFLILSISDFRGFSELGIIAGFGILSIYAVYMLCFPVIGNWLRPVNTLSSTRLFGYFPFGRKWVIVFVPIFLGITYGIFQSEFEYDFERMHNLSKSTRKMKRLTNELFGRSLTPSALLPVSTEQALDLEDWLNDEDRSNVIQDSVSLHTIVPPDMKHRSRHLNRIKKSIDKLSDEELTKETGIEASKIRNWLNQKPYTINDIEPRLRDSFGKTGKIVLAYPKESQDHADSIRRFANVLKEAKTEFPGVKVGSDTLVFIEILDHIIDDGRIVLILFLIGAFFVFWLDFRNIRSALMLEVQLIAGIYFLVGLMGLLGERFSVLNVAMVPAVLAAGVDMGVHVRHREMLGFSPLESAKSVAEAVQLSALTTMIGFGSLFFAQAGMLKGIAWISVLGQFSMYLICMVMMPSIKDYFWNKKQNFDKKKIMSEQIQTNEQEIGDRKNADSPSSQRLC